MINRGLLVQCVGTMLYVILLHSNGFSHRISAKSLFIRFSLVLALIGAALAMRVDEAKGVASVIYANSATGNDSSGDGTSGNPFQTFHKAYTTAISGDTIDLTGTFTWSDAGETGDTSPAGYTLAKNLTIQGQSRATIIQASSTRSTANRSLFFVNANVTVAFRDLTLRYGNPTSGTHGGALTLYGQYCGNYPCSSITGTASLTRVDVTENNSTSGAGAVVQNEASTLTVVDSNITNNVCSCSWGSGAIAGTAQSEYLSVTNSTISGNSATGGSNNAGAISTQRFAQILIQNSTISGNSTSGSGGSSRHYYPQRAIYTNATVVGNTATGAAGGIWFNSLWSGYALWLKNTILADNMGASTPNDFYPDTSSSYSTSEANAVYSVIEHSVSKTFSGTGMITGNQSLLGLDSGLALNGSTKGTKTFSISASSVAVDAGNASAHGPSYSQVTPPTTDQRGTSRAGAPDIGAYEYGTNAPPSLSSSIPTDNATGISVGTGLTLNFSAPVSAVSGKDIVIKKSSDNSVVDTVEVTSQRVSISNSTVTMQISGNLDYSTSYYVLIDSGAFVNNAGIAYGGISSTTTLNFTTSADVSPPVLSSTVPADNALNVATTANISLTFSENVTAVSGKNIVIKKSSNDSVFETISVTNGSRVTVNANVVSINPGTSFDNSTAYYVLIDSGAFRDAAGNSYVGISSSTTLNFEVIASVPTSTTTTTTISPSTPSSGGSSISSTETLNTDAGAQGGTSDAAAVTTTIPTAITQDSGRVRNAAPIPSTSPEEVAPQAPSAEPGFASAFVNGQLQELTVTRENNELFVAVGSIKLRILIRDDQEVLVPLDSDGSLRLEVGDLIEYQLTGALPSEPLDVWLFSDPVKLGSVLVGVDGKASGSFAVEKGFPSGSHRLVLKTNSSTGEEVTLAVGVRAGALNGGVPVSKILFSILLAAIAVGLAIPATRRRRNRVVN